MEFVKGPRGDTPEDQLLLQFQGMFDVTARITRRQVVHGLISEYRRAA